MKNFLINILNFKQKRSLAKLKRLIYYKRMKGNFAYKFICPICKTEQVNLKHDSFSLCYNCAALPRMRSVYHYLEIHNLIFKNQDDRILHIAPESSFYDNFNNFYNNYLAIDKHEKGYKYPLNVKNIDICDLKLENNSQDLIICNHVLEHVSDDKKAIQELYRVIKKNKIVAITVPIDTERILTYQDISINTPKLRKIHYWQEDHLRLYGMDFKLKLESVGFEVNEIHLPDVFSDEIINHFGLGKEILFLCQK